MTLEILIIPALFVVAVLYSSATAARPVTWR